MSVYGLIKDAFRIHRRREVMMLLVILPPLAVFLLYQNLVELNRGEAERELLSVQVEDVIASNSEGTNVRIILDGVEKSLFFRCHINKGSEVVVAKDLYENGDVVYHSTECRF